MAPAPHLKRKPFMRSRTLLRTRIVLFTLITYLVFLPTGPYPLYVAGLRVEYVLFASVCAASLTLFGQAHRQLSGRYGSVQLCIFLYLATITLTTLISSQFDVSFRNYAATVGYAYLTFIIPPLVYRHANVIRQSLLYFAGATTVLFTYLYVAFGYGATQRFALADSALRDENDPNYVDPNMTAIGMVMCVLIALPIIFGEKQQGRWLRKTVNRGLAVAAIGGALFFDSRTAALSLIVGVALGLLRAGTGRRRGLVILRRTIVIVVALMVAAILNSDRVSSVIGRMEDLSQDERTGGRLYLYAQAMQDWTTSGKTVLLGNGYYVSNPHNEFLRTLACDGLVGLLSFVILLGGVYVVACRGRIYTAEQMLNQNILFGFIVSAMMTYGHTKTMWVAIMFLMIGYLEARANDAARRSTETQGTIRAAPREMVPALGGQGIA